MTQEMEAIINSKDKHICVIARAGCVDKDTEFFNGYEWKKISEYNETDKVLQFNKDWSAELVYPKKYIKEHCDTMNAVKSKYGVDMVLSDEHRIIYVDTSRNKNWGEQNILEIKCEDMINRHMKNKKGFYGNFITTFKLKDKGIKYFSSEDEIKMYMAVLSDGNIKDEKNKLVRINLKKDRKKSRLVDLLNNLNINYSVRNDDNGFSVYTFKFEKATKEFDFKLLQMSEHDRKILFDEIPYWDGYYEKFKKDGSISFFTTSKNNADFIQMLGASLNKRGTIFVDDRVEQEQINSKGEIHIRKSICYSVNFTNRVFVSIGNHSNHENRYNNISKYKTIDGYKHCFVVDSGMLVLRRNGKIFITGNSGKSYTMLEYIKSKPSEKILFLVYNKEMQTDFSKKAKGFNNAKIMTIHSLAYKWFVSKYGRRDFKNINIVDIKNILNMNLNYFELSKIKFFYDCFLCSDKDSPFDIDIEDEEYKYLLKFVNVLWDKHRTSSTISHNVYLKMFQLSKPILADYDTILVDEYNDTNACMVDIVANNMDKKIICVGDDLQNLNSFNHTVDGLNIMINKYNFKRYDLTMSFRISEEVADFSSRYLSYMYDKKIIFHGNRQTKIKKLDLRDASKNNQICLLCRNKLGGLKEILMYMDREDYVPKKIFYVGGLDNFGLKEIERIIQYNGKFYLGGEKFTIGQLRKMIDDGVEDPEIIRLVGLYGFATKYFDKINLLKSFSVQNREEADIIVQTAHSSKGMTVKNIIIGHDFDFIESLKMNMNLRKNDKTEYFYNISKSEINLLYVALTRATDYVDIGQAFSRKEKVDGSYKILDYINIYN